MGGLDRDVPFEARLVGSSRAHVLVRRRDALRRTRASRRAGHRPRRGTPARRRSRDRNGRTTRLRASGEQSSLRDRRTRAARDDRGRRGGAQIWRGVVTSTVVGIHQQDLLTELEPAGAPEQLTPTEVRDGLALPAQVALDRPDHARRGSPRARSRPARPSRSRRARRAPGRRACSSGSKPGGRRWSAR